VGQLRNKTRGDSSWLRAGPEIPARAGPAGRFRPAGTDDQARDHPGSDGRRVDRGSGPRQDGAAVEAQPRPSRGPCDGWTTIR